MPSANDYPYDKRYGNDPDRAHLKGLDRLRAIEWRPYAELLFTLWPFVQKNERDTRFHERLAYEERKKREEDVANLESMAQKARTGQYGPMARKIAEDHLSEFGNGRESLIGLRVKLAEMPEGTRQSA